MLLAAILEEVHADMLVGNAFEIERDPHPVGGARTPVALEFHCVMTSHRLDGDVQVAVARWWHARLE